MTTICGLMRCLQTEDQVFLYMETFIDTVTREWPGIDRWRMDKFLLVAIPTIIALFWSFMLNYMLGHS